MDYEEIWESIIETLRGTCNKSIEQVLEEYNRLDLDNCMPFLNYLDMHIFLCDQCSWWCEISEMSDNGEWVCTDCAEENMTKVININFVDNKEE